MKFEKYFVASSMLITLTFALMGYWEYKQQTQINTLQNYLGDTMEWTEELMRLELIRQGKI